MPRSTSFPVNLPSASRGSYPKTRHTRPARVLTSISVRTCPIIVRIHDLIYLDFLIELTFNLSNLLSIKQSIDCFVNSFFIY